jgi:acetyl-CoA synthetase
VPKAYVTLKAGREPSRATAESILAFARKRLAPYKRVRRIEFVTELPKTISGKIRRVQLRAQEVSQGTAAPAGRIAFSEEDFPSLRREG